MTSETIARGRGLARRLALLVGGTLMLSALLLTALSVATSWRFTRADLLTDAAARTALLADTLGGATRFRKSDDLAAALESFATATGDTLDRLTVVAPDGAVLAVSGTENAGAAPEAARAVLETGSAVVEGLTVAAPIAFGADGETVGVLVAGWSTAPLVAAMKAKTLVLGGAGLVVASLAALGAALIAGRLLARPLGGLAETVSRIAGDALDTQVPLTGRGDEIGAIARRVEDLRHKLVEAEDARARQEQARRQAEAAQAEMLGTLESGVGAIVAAARRGEFGRRVENRFSDPVLAALAEGVNALCGTVADFLQEAEGSVGALAQGDLTRKMPSRFEGRLGEVAERLNSSLDSLTAMVARLSETETGMVQAIGVIERESAALSDRSSQQAASLEETSSAMEELTQTTRANADRLQGSAGRAQEARRVAEDGRGIVTRAIDAMEEIETGSSKIGEIISVIDGIAFQTNLLALNAAVEAARAGEAGKGFAVVASEVRTLAQRSAEAARDITRLIETSAGQVRSGAALVNESGTVLARIMDSIAEVSESLEEISRATQEQSGAITEVAQAVSSLDDTTQHSASIATRSASQAAALAEQSRNLARQLDFFRNTGSAAGIAAE